jgi:signal transduction histidine kinase
MNKQSLVLIVDDNPQNLKVLGNTLRENNISPIIVKNGADALRLLNKKNPDLILLDIMMPEMDGFEVCQRLKQNSATKDIPVIFLTAKTEIEHIIKGFEIGAVDYITKPFNSRELIARVNTHLELKAARDTILLQKEELKKANAAKDKFFSIISHDLGNLFNVLIGFGSILIKKNSRLTLDQKGEFIQTMLESSKQGHNLLTNLLAWSKSQTKGITSNPTLLKLQPVINDNIELFNSQVSSKNIMLSSSVAEDIIVFADKDMLNTVIRNLLSNAIKFTSETGKIEISSKQQENAVEISISDTGIGISPQDIDKIFRIDINHNTIGTAEEKGSGLGLILCKEFVERIGGNIWIESEEGKGSTVYIRLPSKSVNHIQ